MPEHRSVRIEADGGSRGNPGPAAYGAVLLDTDTGEVIAERAASIGVATNNVAEYTGLIAGLELYAEHTPRGRARGPDGLQARRRADVRTLEDQAPDMKPLAEQAQRLAPPGTTYTWIPREQNAHADRILNEALDGRRPEPAAVEPPAVEPRGWSAGGAPTTLVLVRHGVTGHTLDKRFSAGLGGSNPGLTDEGRAQVRATADWLAPLAEEIDVVVTSPCVAPVSPPRSWPSAWAVRSSPRTGSPRWSSAAGTG